MGHTFRLALPLENPRWQIVIFSKHTMTAHRTIFVRFALLRMGFIQNMGGMKTQILKLVILLTLLFYKVLLPKQDVVSKFLNESLILNFRHKISIQMAINYFLLHHHEEIFLQNKKKPLC